MIVGAHLMARRKKDEDGVSSIKNLCSSAWSRTWHEFTNTHMLEVHWIDVTDNTVHQCSLKEWLRSAAWRKVIWKHVRITIISVCIYAFLGTWHLFYNDCGCISRCASSLLLMGDASRGKTSFAKCIANDLAMLCRTTSSSPTTCSLERSIVFVKDIPNIWNW